MSYRIFLAGASGVVGRRLAPLLRDAGHAVVGTTRSRAKYEELRACHIEPVVVDVFDAQALMHAVMSARPQIVIHQVTDLTGVLDPQHRTEVLVRNARIREEGTRNLARAAIAAGARRWVVQSIAWMYAPGGEPHSEEHALDFGADGARATTVRGIAALEKWALESPPLEGLVLRYGQFYGPGTGSAAPQGAVPVHVDAAAHAALLAIDHGEQGIYNIAEPNEQIATEKARRELGWRPDFRLST